LNHKRELLPQVITHPNPTRLHLLQLLQQSSCLVDLRTNEVCFSACSCCHHVAQFRVYFFFLCQAILLVEHPLGVMKMMTKTTMISTLL
jgi:hypothetical protein